MYSSQESNPVNIICCIIVRSEWIFLTLCSFQESNPLKTILRTIFRVAKEHLWHFTLLLIICEESVCPCARICCIIVCSEWIFLTLCSFQESNPLKTICRTIFCVAKENFWHFTQLLTVAYYLQRKSVSVYLALLCVANEHFWHCVPFKKATLWKLYVALFVA